MLKLICVIFVVLSSNTNAQSINGTPLKELDIEYIELKVSVHVNHQIIVSYDDQSETAVSNKKPKFNSLKDEEGNIIVLSTRIAALNFFAKNGFELVESYTTESPSFQYFILKKKD
ncbi:MAG: hypothetical protein WEA99_13495 [Brumimicrobium sp.]